MLEFERNSPVETTILAEFFARCGWQEVEAGRKLEWVLAGSEEWITCKLDGELIGFGRSCRLGPARRVVFDVLVDSRFQGSGLRSEIVRLLSENAGSLEEILVFISQHGYRSTFPVVPDNHFLSQPREAPPGAYLGKRRQSSGETGGDTE